MDNNCCTLEELMRSLASMTGNFRGGVTLAGGGAAEASDRVMGLLLKATACALRGLPALRDSVSRDIRRETPAAHLSR